MFTAYHPKKHKIDAYHYPPQNNTLINNILQKKPRNSNLELYRIIVMLLIVAHHYVVNSGLFGVLESDTFSTSNTAMLLFGAWGKTGINCFIMITGWFMCKSNITPQKLFRLYAQIAMYAIIIYGIFCMTGHETPHPVTALLKFFPVKSLNSGFTSCFLVFYLLIPFINKLISVISKKELGALISVLLFFYAILPNIPSFHLSFNYVTWFSILFLISAYIRFYGFPLNISHKSWGFISLALILIASSSVIMLTWMSKSGHMNAFIPYFFISDSNKFLALAIGLSSFMYFKDLKIPHSRLINAIGGTTFGVLLIHANSDAMRQWLWKETVDSMGHYSESVWYSLGYAAATVLLVFVVCSGIDWFRGRLIEPKLAAWFDNLLSRKLISKKANS